MSLQSISKVLQTHDILSQKIVSTLYRQCLDNLKPHGRYTEVMVVCNMWHHVVHGTALKVEAACSSKTLIPICQITDHHIPETVILIFVIVRTSEITKKYILLSLGL
jgi:hypothetical protein